MNSGFFHIFKHDFQNSFNKIIVKRPKIYFLDTVRVTFLLGIASGDQLNVHPLRGALFENLVVSEMIKERTNQAQEINLYYWRDKTGHEIDLMIDRGISLIPIEIKSGKTINKDYFKNLKFWMGLSRQQKGVVLYSGAQNQSRSDGIQVANWKDFLFQK